MHMYSALMAGVSWYMLGDWGERNYNNLSVRVPGTGKELCRVGGEVVGYLNAV